MAITYENTVKINDEELQEVVEDRTFAIIIRTPRSPLDEPQGSRYSVDIRRERIVTRNEQAVKEALSNNVPAFVPTVTIDAAALSQDQEMIDLQEAISAKVDKIVNNL